MKTTAANSTTPIARSTDSSTARADFLAAAGGMSWQLAIVVLVPLLGGYKLDQVFGWSPVLTIIGFLIAMAGMAVVVVRQMKQLSPPITPADVANAQRIRDAEAAQGDDDA